MARRQYSPLNIGEISQGIEACIDNFGDLVKDAEVLIQADRPTRALTCLLVAGQELGKILYLNHMLTIKDDDLDGWTRIWRSFYNHKHKAAGGLLGLLDPSTSVEEIGRLGIFFNAVLGGTAEEERNRTLYVDFDNQTRSWLSPLGGKSEMVSALLPLNQKKLEQLLSDRESGLHSPKALVIIREVCVSNPVDAPDPNSPADPVIAAEYYQELLARNGKIRKRLAEQDFDLS